MARPPSSGSDILLYFIAIFLPPVSVFIKRGCGADFWINIGLSILAWLPGVIHAWWIISRFETPAHTRAAPAPAQQQSQYGATNVAPPPQQPVGGNKY